MTRETKIGLIVGGSFLCLVGIVVASKMRGSEDPSEEQAVQVAAVNPKQNADVKDKDGGKKNEKANEFPPPTQKKPDPKNDMKSLNELLIQTPGGFGTAKDDEKIKQLQAEIRNQNLAPPLGGIQPVDIKPTSDIVIPQPQPVKPLDNKKDEKPPFKPFEFDASQVPPPMPVDKKEPLFPLDKKFDPLDKKDPKDNFPAPPAPKAFGTEIPMPKPFGQEEKKGPGFIEPKNPGGVEAPPPFAPLGKDNGPIIPAPKDQVPPFRPQDIPLMPKDQVPFKPQEFPVIPAPKDQVPFKPLEAPPIVPVTKDPPPVKPVDGPKDIPTIPPIGPGHEAPPIGIGPKPPLPVVKDANPDIIECKPGDTSFAALSQRLYGTEKLAEALHEYNRKHASLLKNGQFVAMAQPILNPGQQVLVPPRELLERDVRTPAISIAPPPAVKLVPPSPINTVSNPPAAPSIGAGRSYVVQNPNGESILDIAERVLGNRNRWTDIYRLNQAHPNVQPQSLTRIPAGTDLKLPAN